MHQRLWTVALECSVASIVTTVVKPGSEAENAELEDGMVIRKVGHTIVKSTADFTEAMQHVKPMDGVLMLVQAGEASRFVVVKESLTTSPKWLAPDYGQVASESASFIAI